MNTVDHQGSFHYVIAKRPFWRFYLLEKRNGISYEY